MPPKGSPLVRPRTVRGSQSRGPRARTTPRKEPRQERSRATVDHILAATAKVLVKEGFDRTSTNRIAEAAGVSIGSLYQYFPSKEALVAALVERHMDEMIREVVAALQWVIEMPLRSAAREVVTLMLKAHAIDPALHRVLIEQVPRVGRLDHIHDVERNVTELVRQYLEAHKDEVRSTDLGMAAFIVVSTVEALTHMAVLHRPELLATEEFVEELTGMVVRYLT
jgi:AcrR family transcriptional regulator